MFFDLSPQKIHSGWLAKLDLEFEARQSKTVLTRNRHIGPLRVQRPFYPEQCICHTYILHPPGGIVGGDRLSTQVYVKSGAKTLITTPGATKFYRTSGSRAIQKQVLSLEDKAILEWFPQETIVFPEANAEMSTSIILSRDAGFMGWDILCIGLPACHRKFTSGSITSRIEIRRDDFYLFKDRFVIREPDDLNGITRLRGFSVFATFMAANVKPEMVEILRQETNGSDRSLIGMTLLDDLLVVRYLGHLSSEAKLLFQGIWAWLRPQLLGQSACIPAIWNT